MAMVIYEVSDGIATLTLNNPQERNSMTADMVAEIVTAMDAAESDPQRAGGDRDGHGTGVLRGRQPG